ncbi:MAG: hypothetical protein U0L22_04520 [Bacteroidales bacterium]|nr:hypothetical protein [Bacteroidales bacterium]
MLSDEERKAINQLKADKSFYDYELKNGNYIYELFKIEVYKKDIDVILNLIEKQSKEIEANKGYHLGFIDGGIAKRYEYEDKIIAKIEEYKKQQKEEPDAYLCIKALSSLLEKE